MSQESPARSRTGSSHEVASVIRGMTVALAGSMFGGGLAFLFLVIMAHLLDQSEFGQLVLALNVLAAATVLSIAGADYATIRYVAAAGSPGAKRGAIIQPLKLALSMTLAISLVILIFANQIAEYVFGEPSLANVLRALALVLPLTIAAHMFSAGLSGLETARGEAVRKIAEPVGRIVLAPVALAAGLGLVGVMFGMAVAAAASGVAVGYLLLRALPRGGKVKTIPLKQVLRFCVPQAVASGASALWVTVNVAILAYFTDPKTVALFGAALAIAKMPLLVYNAFVFRFSPTIARLWEANDREVLSETLKSVTRWAAIFALPLYAFAIVLPASLLEIFGASYTDAATALAIMATASLLSSLAGPTDRALVMTGNVKLEMVTNLFSTAAVIGVALVLTSRFGLVGAAVSAFCYTVFLNSLKTYFVYSTMKMVSVSASLYRPLLAAAVSSLAVVVIETTTGLGASLLGTAALGVMSLVIYGLVLGRLIGISHADRRALRLALRPGR